MSSWVTCPCGHKVSKDAADKQYCLAQGAVDRVAQKIAETVAGGMAPDQSFYMALQFEFDSVLTCPLCGRLLRLRGDEIVSAVLAE